MTGDSYPKEAITAVILAGGQGSRMGGRDKGLLQYQGKALIEHVIDRIRPQVGTMFINANRHQAQYAGYGYAVIADVLGQGEYWGPLAGIASAMQQAHTEYLLSVPCDSPVLPDDLAQRLWQALHQHNADISVVYDGEYLQPVIALWRCSLDATLQVAVKSGVRKTQEWIRSQRHVLVDYSAQSDAFMNVNTPDDLST